MKDFMKILIDAFIKILPYVSEKWYNNKWFWLFWLCVAFLVTAVFMFFFI